MPDEPLPVAVVGLGVFGRLTLQALRQSELVTVVGVADREAAVADRAGAEFGVPAYTDDRRLLVETRPQAVYLAAPPMIAPDQVAFCAQQGIHVWKQPPLARNLGEGLAMVRSMEKAGLKLAVGTQRRFAPTYRRAWELRDRLEQIFLARAHYLFNWGPRLGWRGDKASAGGGALLELAYPSVDLLIWMLGLPEEVYGLAAVGSRPPAPADEPQPGHDTDDTAAAILDYGGGRMATVVATRSSGPVSEALCLHGRGGSLTADTETCLLRDPDGNIVDRTADESPPLALLQRQSEAFARSVLDEAKFYECSGRENLLNLATIDAIYLSARTSHPEHPARLLETSGLTPDACLTHRPAPEES